MIDNITEEMAEALLSTSPEKRELLTYLLKIADKAILTRKGRTNHWNFYFDDGVMQGGWWKSFNQKTLDAYAVLSKLMDLPWPGFKSMKEQLNGAAYEILKKGGWV